MKSKQRATPYCVATWTHDPPSRYRNNVFHQAELVYPILDAESRGKRRWCAWCLQVKVDECAYDREVLKLRGYSTCARCSEVGYCSAECLKGANACHCAWDDHICGDKTPEELAAGVRWTDASGSQQECWRMATKSTVQVMTGIAYHQPLQPNPL